MDIFQRKMWFAYEDHSVGGIVELSLDRIHEIIESNKVGKPDKLEEFFKKVEASPVVDYENVVGQDSIDRFDSKGKRSKRRNNNKKGKNFRGKNRNQNKNPKHEKVWANTFSGIFIGL